MEVRAVYFISTNLISGWKKRKKSSSIVSKSTIRISIAISATWAQAASLRYFPLKVGPES